MISSLHFQMTSTEGLLAVLCLTSLFLIVVLYRRQTQLQARLLTAERHLSREIKMVNQGAIGVGRRIAAVEKKLKSSANVASFAAARELTSGPDTRAEKQAAPQETSAPVKTGPVRVDALKSTKAEQALSAWLNSQRNSA